jgi:hypothetical protein
MIPSNEGIFLRDERIVNRKRARKDFLNEVPYENENAP